MATPGTSPALDVEGGTVLVVDDDPESRMLLGDLLRSRGYTVHEAGDGAEALAWARSHDPDAILMDVVMPRMDGVEACRRLKADPETAPIPVILVTALQRREDRIRGIDAGADDFLNKPLDVQEVTLRTRNAVVSKGLYDSLQESYEKLVELEELRDSMTQMIVHDLRSPLTGILASLELLEMEAADSLDEEHVEDLERARQATRSLVRMVTALLDVNLIESGEFTLRRTEEDLEPIARDALASLGGLTRDRDVRVEVDEGPVRAPVDAEQIERVIANLLANALEHGPDDGTVRLRLAGRSEGDGVRVEVRDEGPGIPEEHRERIFEKWFQVESADDRRRRSTGLGLTFCKMVVEAHGGEIGVDSDGDRGSTFWFTLPG